MKILTEKELLVKKLKSELKDETLPMYFRNNIKAYLCKLDNQIYKEEFINPTYKNA